MSDEEKEYRRKLKLGTHASEEMKQKMSKTRKGKPQNMTDKKIAHLNNMHNNWRGKHHTAEAIERIREASTGRLHTEEVKQRISNSKFKTVLCIELNKEFKGVQAAADFINDSYYSIYKCVSDKTNNRTAGGYHWQYKNNK